MKHTIRVKKVVKTWNEFLNCNLKKKNHFIGNFIEILKLSKIKINFKIKLLLVISFN